MGNETTTAAEPNIIGSAGTTETAGADAAAAKSTEGAAAAGTEQTAEQKTAADAKATEAAKATIIELKLPEGFKPDEAAIGDFKKVATELGLDSAKAQKVFDVYAKTQAAQLAAQDAAVTQQEKAWGEELRADKEFGGTNFKANVELVGKALVKFDPDGSARKAIGESGLGSHPAVVKLLGRIGKAISEDHVGKGGAGAESVVDEAQARLQRAYPTMFNPDGTPKATGERKATS